MAQHVYVHVGLPKTGTTFLQTAMWHNRRPLEQQGFLYPGRRRMDHYHASRVIRGASESALGANARTWAQLRDALDRWPGRGLVSHEFLSMATAAQARRAVEQLAPAEVQVVVTARDYARQFPAVWQEALKMNSDLGLDEFMERAFARELPGAWSWRSQDLPAVVERWAAAVSPDRIHVVTVPPPGAPRDLLWRRWCEVLEVDDRSFDMDLTFGNESLGAPQAALLRQVKPHLSGPLVRGPERHRWVRAYFGHQVLVPQRGARFGLRADHVTALARQARTDVARLADGGYRVHGDLEDLVPADPQPPMAHPDEVSEREMLDVAAVAIEQMIRDVRALTKERDTLRRRAASAPPAPPPRSRARRTLGRLRRLLHR